MLAHLLLAALACQADRPNLVLIVADDLGWGDLSCYGQRMLETPHIDRLAAAGRRYTQFYAGSTVCAPSRCVLMTGRHTGHCTIRGNARQNLPAAEVTMAEVLREAGYRTGAFGKWGIGHEGSDGMPTRQGFERFFGYLDQAHAHNYYPSFLIRDEARVRLKNVVPNEGERGQGVATEKVEYSHDLIVDAALRWLDQVGSGDEPFFLFLPWTIPHANNEGRRRGMEVPELGEFEAAPWPEPERGFAAMVQRLDRDVGRVVERLERLGVTDRTLVMFTSDNGPHLEGGHRADYFDSNGPLRGIKRSLHEGGIRVPLIARWPGVVAAGSESEQVAAFQDLLPTFAALAGRAAPAGIDGVSFAPELRGQAEPDPARELYWAFYERGGGQAVRFGRWKAVQQPIHSAVRLYDLDADLREARDVAAAHPEVAAEAVQRMAAAYEPSARWRFPERLPK